MTVYDTGRPGVDLVDLIRGHAWGKDVLLVHALSYYGAYYLSAWARLVVTINPMASIDQYPPVAPGSLYPADQGVLSHRGNLVSVYGATAPALATMANRTFTVACVEAEDVLWGDDDASLLGVIMRAAEDVYVTHTTPSMVREAVNSWVGPGSWEPTWLGEVAHLHHHYPEH